MAVDRLPCPECAELVKRAAWKCPLCGFEFTEEERADRMRGQLAAQIFDRVALVFFAIAACFALVALVAYLS